MRIGAKILGVLFIVPFALLSLLFAGRIRADHSGLPDAVLAVSEGAQSVRLIDQAAALGVKIVQAPKGETDAILSTREGSVIGAAKIQTFLSERAWVDPQWPLGLRAALLLLGLQGLVFLYRKNLAAYAVLLVPIGLCAGLAYAIPCVSCGSIKPTDLMPSLAVFVLVGSGLIFAFQRRSPRWLRLLALATLCSTGVVQAILLYRTPLLCPLCITLGAVMAILAYAVLDLLDGRVLPDLPGKARLGYAGSCAAVLILQTGRLSILGPHLKPSLDSEAAITARVINRSLASMAHGLPAPNSLVVVTRAGCQYCDAAKRQLAVEGVRYTELPACELGGDTPCFDADRTPVGFPTILMVDHRGVVRDAKVGWPNETREVFDLLERLREWRKH